MFVILEIKAHMPTVVARMDCSKSMLFPIMVIRTGIVMPNLHPRTSSIVTHDGTG